jgi:hypothetical protein
LLFRLELLLLLLYELLLQLWILTKEDGLTLGCEETVTEYIIEIEPPGGTSLLLLRHG